MDIRILTLFLLVTIAGSFADLRSPFFRIRRNGLQESGKSHVELAGMPRAKRETTAESTAKSTATPKRTTDPPARGTNPMRTTKKPDSEPSPESDSSPPTSSTPDSSSTSEPSPTTGSTPKPAAKPAPKPAAKPKSTTPRPKSATTAKPRTTTAATRTPRPATAARRAPRPTGASTTTPRSIPASARTPRPATAAANRTPRPSTPARRTPKPIEASARAPRPTTEATASSIRAPRPVAATRAARPSTIAATTPRPTTISTTTTKPSDSGDSRTESPDASPVIGSRINPSEENPQENPQEDLQKDPQQSLQPKFQTGPQDSRKAVQEPSVSEPNTQMGPVAGSLNNPGFQNFPIPQFPFIPSFIPNFSPYNPYSDPLFNSIPGPSNNAWTGSNSGSGMASSSASASAGAFAGASGGSFAGSRYGNPPVSDRGSFVDSATNAVNTPTADYMPNAFSWGSSNNGGGNDPAFDQSSFMFPGYNPENMQKQMEDNYRQWQAQFQRQQQALFDTFNRIGTDGYSGNPGANSAVSSINLGPGGGYQAGAINPAAPGVASRFAEELPAPSGNSFGVFSGSSSRTVVGPDGKPVSHKVSTTGVNDNGKITFRTVQD